MLEKWNEIKNMPITWGDYGKLCKWCILIYGIGVAIWWISWYTTWFEEIGDKISGFWNRIRNREHEEVDFTEEED